MDLDRKAILDADDIEFRHIYIPEWKGRIKLKTMSGSERDEFDASLFKDGKADVKNIRAKLLIHCIVDDDNKRVFTAKDVDPLGRKTGRALDRLYDIAREMNGIGADVEGEIAKNSEGEVIDTSISTSPANSE